MIGRATCLSTCLPAHTLERGADYHDTNICYLYTHMFPNLEICIPPNAQLMAWQKYTSGVSKP